jgi:Zn-dependent peptidase ImmA (M78 family)
MCRLSLDDELPYSATAQWEEHRWVIIINGKEPYLRQRFSLAHEIKHIIDHKYKYELYLDPKGIVHNEKAEQQADYFAACLLMPKDKVTRLYNNGITSPTILAKFFEVSPLAMHIRMRQLKLTTTWQNCKLRIQYKFTLIRMLMRLWHVLHYPEEIRL